MDFKFSIRELKETVFFYKWTLLFFFPFLIIQCFHIIQQHWDTQAYIFGGKWFCGQQIYFEFIRPPFPSFLNCVFGAGDYAMLLSTVFACVLYFIAIGLIFKNNSDKLNQLVFALFAFLFPSILLNSNFGADLLALAFLLLALEAVSPKKKGFLFALSCLSRYNYLLFALVFLFELRKKPKDVLSFLLAFILPCIPWMIFNYLFTGNPLFSIFENYYLNVGQKGLAVPFLFEHLVVIIFFIITALFVHTKKSFSLNLNRVSVLGAIMFAVSGIKEMRFLNMLVPAIAFNCALLVGKKPSRKIIFSFLLLWLFVAVFVFSLLPFILFSWHWYSVVSVPNDDFIKNCRVASDKWVFFYEEGIVAEVIYDISDWNSFVKKGGSIVLFDYKNYDLNSVFGEKIFRSEYVIIKSSSCAPQPKKYISGSLRNNILQWLKGTNSVLYDYSDWYE